MPDDHDLRKGHLTGEGDQLLAADRVLGEVDLLEGEVAPAQQVLRLDAARAGIGRVDDDLWAVRCLDSIRSVAKSRCRRGFPPAM